MYLAAVTASFDELQLASNLPKKAQFERLKVLPASRRLCMRLDVCACVVHHKLVGPRSEERFSRLHNPRLSSIKQQLGHNYTTSATRQGYCRHIISTLDGIEVCLDQQYCKHAYMPTDKRLQWHSLMLTYCSLRAYAPAYIFQSVFTVVDGRT
eukprot:11629-Heterococcus_DN1.PRE.1